jgi:2-C-methyl-D-erythritol 2,4-cyclodiphosphate synthase|tara:strand:- start:47 stop:541 length:495 start_codon:yes stop_codon:yes gene_type:complete
MPKSNYRIGHGYDVHRLEEGADCWIGGIKLKHTKGAVGHSDADVVIHVICDALLGALNLRDIGFHFSDTDEKYKDIDSKKLLKKVIDMVRRKNYEVNNIDVTIMAEYPKLSPHINEMQNILSKVMEIEKDLLSIKATTTEGLGFIGREEGIAATCVVLLRSDQN